MRPRCSTGARPARPVAKAAGSLALPWQQPFGIFLPGQGNPGIGDHLNLYTIDIAHARGKPLRLVPDYMGLLDHARCAGIVAIEEHTSSGPEAGEGNLPDRRESFAGVVHQALRAGNTVGWARRPQYAGRPPPSRC